MGNVISVIVEYVIVGAIKDGKMTFPRSAKGKTCVRCHAPAAAYNINTKKWYCDFHYGKGNNA